MHKASYASMEFSKAWNESGNRVLARQASKDNAMHARQASMDGALIGSLGAEKGGRVRAGKLTPEQRSEIAQKAAKARWK